MGVHTSKMFNLASPLKLFLPTPHPMSLSSQTKLPSQTPKGKGKLSVMPQPGPSWKMPNCVIHLKNEHSVSNNLSLWYGFSIGEDMLEEISSQLSKLESNPIHSMSSTGASITSLHWKQGA